MATPKSSKRSAGAGLSQKSDTKPKGTNMAKNEQTGKKAGTAASKVLRDGRTGKDSKTAAGSALSQRPSKK